MLKRSIEIDPSTTTAAQAYNYLGYMWADRSENLEEAGEMIRKAVAMDPENGAFLDSLGWYHYKKGEYDKALKELLRAAEVIKPEDPTVLEHIGDTYHQLGKVASALQYWQKAQGLDAGNTKIGEKIEAAKQKVSANTVAQ
jgi:Tfp pilus assembly protein PilF